MMDYSDLDQNLIISLVDEDVENPTDRSPLHAKNIKKPPKKHMDSSNTTSLMSSIFRTVPLLIKHTAPPSRSRGGVNYDYSTIESDSDRQTGEDGDKKSSKVVEFDDEKERERLADIMQAGLKHLLSNVHDRNTLFGLGLKVILEIDHEQIQEDFEDSAEKTCDEPTFQLKAEDAVGLLLDYAGFWHHSCSIVLTDLTTRHNGKLPSIPCGRKTEEKNQSSTGYAEVVLFVLIDGAYGEIDEQSIWDSEQLKKFLIEQSENKMLGFWKKVHAICSSVTI